MPNPIDIETAAYSLLTLVHKSETKLALPVMNWLISHQNKNGGFSSTQDTILALQALSQMASKMNSGHNVSCKIKFGYNKALLSNKPSPKPLLAKVNRSSEINTRSTNDEIEIKLEAKELEFDQFELSESDLLYEEHLAQKPQLSSKSNHDQSIRRKLVNRLPDYVEIEAKGNGTAVLQVSWQYNLNTETEESPFFLESQINSLTTDQMSLDICS